MNNSDQVKKNSFEQALNLLINAQKNTGIYGLKGSSPEFLMASAARKGLNIVYVLPDGDRAALSAANLRFFLGEDEATKYPLEDKVVRFPSYELAPFSFIGLENEAWVGRMTGLFRFAEGPRPQVVVLGLDSLMRKLIPKEHLSRATFSISVGQDLDRDELIHKLVASGYSRSPLVEDAGDFSVRGFVLDVYSPIYPFPLRIEQMGDRIESIRLFDPVNQRSKDALSEATITPIHMMIPDEIQREKGVERLYAACEERGIEKRIRQRLMDDLGNSIRFPGSEVYLPYFFPRLETVLDYLDPSSVLVLPDLETIERCFEDFNEELVQGLRDAQEDGALLPEPEDLFLFKDEFFHQVSRFRNVILSQLELEDPGRETIRVMTNDNLDIRSELIKSKNYDSGMAGLITKLKNWRSDGSEVFLVSHTHAQSQRLLRLLEPYDLNLDFRGSGFDPSNLEGNPVPGIRLYVGTLSAGFRIEESRLIIITEEEIFGTRVRQDSRKRARGTLLSSLNDLVEGAAIVHEDYGIGIFRGLARKEFDGILGEVMIIEFADGDLLYHPVERLQVIQQYVSGSEGPPRIDKLGGKGWEKTKARIKQSIRDMAKELLEIYAKRKVATRRPYSLIDENFEAFEASFEFEETPDQAKAIQEVMEAMDSDVPMDRLVCGDVGYGKTEVALRAAFRAVMDGKQVGVLVPTTVLAQQHYDTFLKRFRGQPFSIEVLSRFRSSKEQKEVISRLAEGKVDIVIGTHKLLGKEVHFRDLGLLVVDEEQRFGVAHKEKIKRYKAHVDILTLTATPIPRTLNLSLTGIRDLSVIETPPTNRQSIRTHVMKESPEIIREAITRELGRGGQVFYLHNRVQSIFRKASTLRELVPEARIGVAHGQMPDNALEEIMMDFVTGKINVLVCTSIIESGLDIPRANTIIIERADTFGLADLYQLRGRVGRSNMRAHAYLLTPHETLMTPDAIKRLAVLQEFTGLGQGFRIAMRDMEIRGAGNLLGTSQSGHVALVGYEMYLDLLEEAVQEIKGEEPVRRIDPDIHLRLEVIIPEEYVPEPQQRMSLYKRLSRAEAESEIDEVEEEIFDRYGRPPVQTRHLLQVMRIRLMMKECGLTKLDYNGNDLVFTFDSETSLDPQALIFWIHKDKRMRLITGDRLGVKIGKTDPEKRLNECFTLLKSMKELISGSERSVPPPEKIQPKTRIKRAGTLKMR